VDFEDERGALLIERRSRLDRSP